MAGIVKRAHRWHRDPDDAENETMLSIGHQRKSDRLFVMQSLEPDVDGSDVFLIRRRDTFKTAFAAGKLRWDVNRPFPGNPGGNFCVWTSGACFLTVEEAVELHRRWFENDTSIPVAERCVGMVKLSDVFWR